MGKRLEDLIELLDLEELEVNIFRGPSPKVKRQVSAFTVPGAAQGTPHARNIAAVDKKLVGAIDFYDSDFGLIQIVLDRWVPESTNTTTATASATATGGQMFFLSRAINRIAWLRPVHHELIGKRGDSVAGYVVGECTLEVLAEHGLHWVHPPLAMAHPLDDGTAAELMATNCHPALLAVFEAWGVLRPRNIGTALDHLQRAARRGWARAGRL